MEILLSIIKEQVKEYRKLLDLAKKKQEILLNNEIEELERLNKEEQKIILSVSKLENERLKTIGTLTEVLGAKVQTITLKEIAQIAPESYQGKFSETFSELNEIIEELEKMNKQNSGLIQQALKIVNFTLETLANSERDVTYPERDSKSTNKSSKIFDQKA